MSLGTCCQQTVFDRKALGSQEFCGDACCQGEQEVSKDTGSLALDSVSHSAEGGCQQPSGQAELAPKPLLGVEGV